MTVLSLPEAHQEARRSPGVILFTVSAIADRATTMARLYTSHPDVYPVGGRKTLDGQTSPFWFEQVVRGGHPFLGPDTEAVRSFFFDSSTIESLGCGAIINVPVRYRGETIGSINFLDAEGAYDASSVDDAVRIAARVVDAVREAARTV
ncbi:GAF domain-containing protein [Microbacterium sp.]|uniref:GAF domain-containing protein n=1 Tax=Microbacterium sp. TaxID=51671 RepID=UPI003A87FAE7